MLMLPKAGPAAVLAGLAVGAVVLAEGVAYAGIAHVPPARALLAALIGLTVYPLLGSSRFAIVAPTSSAAAIFASVLGASAGAAGQASGALLVVVAGLLMLLAGALHGSFLAAFIARPVLRGFAWALATTIVVRQIPHVLGLHIEAGGLFAYLHGIATHLRDTQPNSALLGVLALATYLLIQRLLTRWVPLPASLIVLLAGAGAARLWDLAAAGVQLVGPITFALSWPSLDLFAGADASQVVHLGPALVLVLFAESWGSVRSLALKHGDGVDARRELYALGVCNVLCGLCGALPVGAGFSAATINEQAGARSRWNALLAGVLLALLLWAGRDLIAALPLPVLSGVVIGILSHNLWPRALKGPALIWKTAEFRRDLALAVVTATSVLLLGVLAGLGVAVLLSLVMVIWQFAAPVLSLLGRMPGTTDFVDRRLHPGAQPPPPGVLVVRPEEPLFFANTENISAQIERAACTASAHCVIVSLEACSSLDTSSVEALTEFRQSLGADGRTLVLARVRDPVRQALQAAGWPADGVCYRTVDEALRVRLTPSAQLTPSSPAARAPAAGSAAPSA